MNKRIPLLFLLPLLAAAGRAAETEPPEFFKADDALAASVNGYAITQSDVIAGVGSFLAAAREDLGPTAEPRAVFRKAFELSLRAQEDRRLVLQEYERGDARISDSLVDRAVAQTLEEQYGGDMQKLQKELAERRMTYTEWKDRRREWVIATAMRNTYVAGNVHVSPKEIEEAYAADPARWAEPARLHVRLAALAYDDSAGMESFRSRLAAGEAFADLARELSLDVHAAQGGDYGWVVPSEALAAPLAAAATALPDGGVSDPVPVAGLRFLVFREASEPAETPTLADAWDRISRELLGRREDELYESWIGHLRASASIREYPVFAE